MFEFHRVGWINGDNKQTSGWYCLIRTWDQMKAYLEYNAYEMANIWLDIKQSPDYKWGHCRTTKANAMKTILQIKMEKEGLKKMSMPDCVNFIESEFNKGKIKLFLQDGEVYVNAVGGCRPTSLRNDHRGVDEHIFETCFNKDFVFPTLGCDEIKITRWPMSPHFYISVNGTNIEVDGVPKWNTAQAAEEAKEKFLKRNRFRPQKKVKS